MRYDDGIAERAPDTPADRERRIAALSAAMSGTIRDTRTGIIYATYAAAAAATGYTPGGVSAAVFRADRDGRAGRFVRVDSPADADRARPSRMGRWPRKVRDVRAGVTYHDCRDAAEATGLTPRTVCSAASAKVGRWRFVGKARAA